MSYLARMTAIKVLGAVLGAAACLITFLALTEEYDDAMRSEARQGRVIAVEGDVVRYEILEPGSPWDEDGDGWIGPYTDEGVPEAARAALHPGDAVSVKSGQLEQSLSPPTPLLLVGVVICLLLGVWAIVAPIRDRRALAAARGDAMRVIEHMVRKSRSAKIVAGVTLFVIGVGFMALAVVLGSQEPLWQVLFIAGLGVLSLGLGAVAARGAWSLRDPGNAPVLRAIREEPQRIVWIYEHVLRVNGVPTHTLFVCRDDGQRYDFSLGQTPAAELMDNLAQLLPHAVLGYSREREVAYKSAPAQFRAAAA